MFTNEAFAFLKSSALVIAGKCVWRSLQSAVKLLPPKVLQSGLSGAIPSLLHKRHSAQAGRRQHSVWLEALWKICVFLRGRLSWLMNIKEENVLLNDLCASNCLCELVLFLFLCIFCLVREEENLWYLCEVIHTSDAYCTYCIAVKKTANWLAQHNFHKACVKKLPGSYKRKQVFYILKWQTFEFYFP